MRARARLRIDAGGRVADLTEQPPVAWRRTPGAMYLVGTAGGLTGDDDVGLDVDVADGGRLVVRSAAATVAYEGFGTVHHSEATVGQAASLEWCPEPLIITAGADHLQSARVRLACDAELDWTEIVLLGRHGEQPGRAHLRLDCTITGADGTARPLLRHHLAVGPGMPGWDGPAVLDGYRAVGLRLCAGPDLSAPRSLRGEGWAWMRLAGPGWMLSAVAVDLPSLSARMAEASSTLALAGSTEEERFEG